MKEKNKQKSVLNYLFFCIIINMIPPIMLAETSISGSVYTLINAVVYMLEVLIMLYAIKENISKVSSKKVVALILLVLLQVLTQIVNIYKGYPVIFEDIIHIISVTINIFTFIICMPYAKITNQELIEFMKKMVCLGVIACLYNLIKNITLILNITSLSSSYAANISAFFPNRNQFGIFLLTMILSNLYVKQNDDRKRYKYIEILFIINLLLTMSRNSILGLITIYVIRFYNEYLHKRKFSKIKLLAVITIGLALVIGIVVVLTNEQYMAIVEKLFIRSDTLETGSGRTKLWQNAIEMTMENNWIIGLGRFNAIRLNSELYNSELEFHSVYIETFAIYGAVGVILLVAFIFKIIKKIIKSDIKIKNNLITTIVVFLVISIFETVTRFSIGYADMMGLIYFIALPLLISNIEIEQKTL